MSEYRNKMLFIDDAFLLEVHNLKRKVNQAIKHPEPVLKLDAPWDTEESDSFNYINVIYDEQEKLFKMWYVVTGHFPGEYWERGRKTAYATSKDGIHWEKPVMNMVEINGSKQNNYIIILFGAVNLNHVHDGFFPMDAVFTGCISSFSAPLPVFTRKMACYHIPHLE